MRVRVLGCSGGIGGAAHRTTSFLVDDDILLDAGTGVGDLALEQLARIDHVFLTHSHLDHVASLPLLVDTVGGLRRRPIVVHATGETLAILRRHLFNWELWPDFAAIPNTEAPWLRYEPIAPGRAVRIAGRSFTALPAEHTVPAVGYRLDSGAASLVFTGDTGPNEALWPIVNRIANLKILIIETAFPNSEGRLAARSGHLCPRTLAAGLAKLERAPGVWITHLKPGEAERTMRETRASVPALSPQMLQNGQVFEF